MEITRNGQKGQKRECNGCAGVRNRRTPGQGRGPVDRCRPPELRISLSGNGAAGTQEQVKRARQF